MRRWSAPLLFAYAGSRFSHDVAQIYVCFRFQLWKKLDMVGRHYHFILSKYFMWKVHLSLHPRPPPHFSAYLTIFCSQLTIKCLGSEKNLGRVGKPETFWLSRHLMIGRVENTLYVIAFNSFRDSKPCIFITLLKGRAHAIVLFSAKWARTWLKKKKKKKMHVRPAKTQISLCICPVWVVFAVRFMGS